MKYHQPEAERETMAYLLGVFLTSLGLIALEIGITRVFSTMIRGGWGCC
jgi:hypothetical protein